MCHEDVEAQLPEEISSQVLQTGPCTFPGLPVQGCLYASENLLPSGGNCVWFLVVFG